jgi:hypothetical protein
VAPTLGSPGFVGFLFTFLLAAALIALAWSLTRQLRKVDRNARLKAAAEEGAANKPEADDSAAAVAAATPSATSENFRPLAPDRSDAAVEEGDTTPDDQGRP